MGSGPSFSGAMGSVGTLISQKYKPSSNDIELCVYETTGIGTGRMANNPWLQEFPDPVSRACWENYLTIPPSMAAEWDFEMEEGQFTKLVNLQVNGQTITLPALIQPGQAKGTVGLALGYGRTVTGKVGDNIGVDAYPLLKMAKTALAIASIK